MQVSLGFSGPIASTILREDLINSEQGNSSIQLNIV